MFWDRRAQEPQHQAERQPPAVDADVPAQPSFLSSVGTLRPSLGADASVSGRLSFTRPTRLDGTLRGEVHSSDVLVIGETGLVTGVVRADTLVILGRVLGDVVETRRVEVARGGLLRGDVEARALVVQEGGHFEGSCRISPPTRATVHVLHPKGAATAGKADLT